MDNAGDRRRSSGSGDIGRRKNNNIESVDESTSDTPVSAESELPSSMNSSISMMSIPESGVVEKRTTSTDEERGDGTEKRKSPESWRQTEWDDVASVSSGHTFQSYASDATSESVQSIIQRLQSETDRRRRRLMRRRSMRSGNGRFIPHNQQPSSPRGFTVEVVQRNRD